MGHRAPRPCSKPPELQRSGNENNGYALPPFEFAQIPLTLRPIPPTEKPPGSYNYSPELTPAPVCAMLWRRASHPFRSALTLAVVQVSRCFCSAVVVAAKNIERTVSGAADRPACRLRPHQHERNDTRWRRLRQLHNMARRRPPDDVTDLWGVPHRVELSTCVHLLRLLCLFGRHQPPRPRRF